VNVRKLPTIWVVCEDRILRESLAVPLRSCGRILVGPPERSHWKESEGPDLLVMAAPSEIAGDLSGLERLLGFVRALPRPLRGPVPALYVEGTGPRPPTALARSLIDDRPMRVVESPFEADELLTAAEALLGAHLRPLSLRDRARSEWVARRVELFYADLELPSLRHAIDPHNAARPALLLGEAGTGAGLLARYIQNLAEPAREALVLVPVTSLEAGRVEERIAELCAGRRVSAYLSGLDRAPRALQEELAQVLGQSGWLGVEAVRWIASAAGLRHIASALLALPWLRVDLPPLRQRPDLAGIAHGLTRRWAETAGREARLADDAIELLRDYTWPGNLEELESVLELSLAASSNTVLGAADLRIVPESGPTRPAPVAARSAEEVAPPARPVRGEQPPATAPASEPPRPEPLDPEARPGLPELMPPLAHEFRGPLLAIRTYASLLEQQPDDATLRRELTTLVEGDLVRLDELFARLERFTRFAPPHAEPLDLASLVTSELEKRQSSMRTRSLVVLRELDHDAPPALADDEQIRFALGALLDRALPMVPAGGDLYIGSHHHPADDELPARHRLLIRFHSPEDVLVAPDENQGPRIPLDVLMARALVLRMNGTFAIDSSGEQDNVILVELPS